MKTLSLAISAALIGAATSQLPEINRNKKEVETIRQLKQRVCFIEARIETMEQKQRVKKGEFFTEEDLDVLAGRNSLRCTEEK